MTKTAILVRDPGQPTKAGRRYAITTLRSPLNVNGSALTIRCYVRYVHEPRKALIRRKHRRRVPRQCGGWRDLRRIAYYAFYGISAGLAAEHAAR